MRNKYNADHILSLCDQEYIKKYPDSMCPPPMDAQVALDELRRYFLGDDWYTTWPVPSIQVNAEIVAAIEQQYKGCKLKRVVIYK